MMMMNSPWFSESSPARVRNSPWFSRKFPCYGFKIPPGLLTLSVSLEPHVGHQMLEITSEMTQNKTHTHKRQMIHTVRLEEQNCANYLRFIIIKPLYVLLTNKMFCQGDRHSLETNGPLQTREHALLVIRALNRLCSRLEFHCLLLYDNMYAPALYWKGLFMQSGILPRGAL